MGGTGSAKSSFVNLLSRLYDVEKGNVIVGGKDVREYDLDVLRKEVSVVLQKNVLFSGTILENLRWGDENATDLIEILIFSRTGFSLALLYLKSTFSKRMLPLATSYSGWF